MKQGKYTTIEQAAERLNVSKTRIYQMEKEGKLKAHKSRDGRVYLTEEIDKLFEPTPINLDEK